MSRGVLVTGGSRGIGAAIAAVFASQGDRVAVHASAPSDHATATLTDLPGTGHGLVYADLLDADQIRRMVDEAAELLGGIDVLVNNAGVFFTHPVGETDYAAWQQAWQATLGVNLLGAANVTWCALQHMPDGGRIVNVGSRGAFRGEPRSPAYGASKAALVAFGQSLAKDLGPRRIAVTTLAPGFVETDMAASELVGEKGAIRRAESPYNRVANVAEVAEAVLYLASPQAEWASGAVLDFNGASYLRM